MANKKEILQAKIIALERAFYNYNYEKTIHGYKGPIFLQDFVIYSSEYLEALKKSFDGIIKREKEREYQSQFGEIKRKIMM